MKPYQAYVVYYYKEGGILNKRRSLNFSSRVLACIVFLNLHPFKVDTLCFPANLLCRRFLIFVYIILIRVAEIS